MRQFKEDVQIVLNTVRSPIYKPDSVSFHQKVFSELENYLQINGLLYSEQTILVWIHDLKLLLTDPKIYQRYRGCVSRLIDVIVEGKVSRLHIAAERIKLSDQNQKILNEYIEWIRKDISKNSIKTHRWSVSFFLRFAQSQKVNIQAECSIELFEKYIDFITDPTTVLSTSKSELAKFCEYLEFKNIIEKDLHWFFNDFPRIKRPENYSNSFLSTLESYRTMDSSLSLDEYRIATANTLKYLSDNEYMGAVIITAKRTFRLLYYFLIRYELMYHPILAENWICENKDTFLGAWDMARRALDILAAIAVGSTVSKRISVIQKYPVPEWALDQYQHFIRMKIKARFDEDTIDMFRVCIKRFLAYLDNAGVRSYTEITPDLIHLFNRDDKHSTNYSKNAYNSRIRRFLEYLEINRITSCTGLQYSLVSANSSGERIIDILSPVEIKTIHTYCRYAKSPLELRTAAMILLALKMGLRSSDVINLELDDIDWKEMTIHFTQFKTKKELCLPMPVEVGNAIYAYLLKSRPRNIKSKKVFVSLQKPFSSLSGSVLRKSLRRALPDRNVPKSGFHVLRRTFSSITLNSGNTPEMVAEVIGHSGTGNVHKYLSMDSSKMRKCCLSFEEAGIGGVPHAR